MLITLAHSTRNECPCRRFQGMNTLVKLLINPPCAVIKIKTGHAHQKQLILSGEMLTVADKKPALFIQQTGFRPGIN